MHKLRLIICAPFLLLLTFFFACNDEESYSSSPQDLLSFSSDTIRFDTILSTVNTPFKAFMVYNKNSKPLLISSVRLKNSGQSGFKINVNGSAGSSFENVEIRAKDSLFVFVDIKPDMSMDNQPVLITDYIEFVTNNVRQEVVLEAYNQDVVIWKGQTILSDSILDNRIPYLIYDSLVIEEGISVGIKEGTVFYMHHNAEIIVKGTLNITGTPENPVTIRGDRMDEILTGVPYNLIPGQWGGIRFTSTSFNNVFENAHIRNGNYGLNLEVSEPIEPKLTMKNVVLTNAKGILINSVNCKLIAENCEFSNSKGALLNLIGGHYSFAHCTMANYYFSDPELGWGNSDNETVVLSNYIINWETENEYYPLEQAAFYNSIIWGSKYRTTSEVSIRANKESSVSYYFQNCLIPNADATNDDINNTDTIPTVVDCLFNVDPKFRDSNPVKDGKYEFIYDFRIDSLSPARNVANPDIARLIPLDMNGLDRFSDDGPDMGGYEYYKENEEKVNE